jgi:hypothetical protein
VKGNTPAADDPRFRAGGLRFRAGGPGDAPAVAGLHADSWRRHYRGAFSDAFLDRDVAGYPRTRTSTAAQCP